jgi:uncharacterized protein (DUF433 family)
MGWACRALVVQNECHGAGSHAINYVLVKCRREAMEGTVKTHERIEINPEIMGGKPVIRGTRVPVELVLRKLGAGMMPEAIMADHPRLTPEDIYAAQSFAADYLADESLVDG